MKDQAVTESISRSAIDRAMLDADVNGDGKIDFDEFVCLMRGEKYRKGAGGGLGHAERDEKGKLVTEEQKMKAQRDKDKPARSPRYDKDKLTSYRQGGHYVDE